MSTEPPPVDEKKTYYGNCHCGAFKFRLVIPELKEVTECNCSICFKKGYKWVFPGEGGFIVDKGEGKLREYNFGPHTMSHCFCPTCGSGILGKRHGVPAATEYGINARALLDVDVFALKINKYDGLPREPKYIPPSFTGSEPTPTTEFKDPKLYTGGCHCGAVTIALKTDGPLSNDAEGFLQCDCSICMRNGTILAYPSPSQVSVTNAESLTPYSFARKFQSHDFCPVCGIAIWLRKLDVSEERWAAEHPDYPYSDFLQKLPVNLRLFEGVEWDEIEIPNGNWSQRPPKYVCPE